MEILNHFNPRSSFTYDFNKKYVVILDCKVIIFENKFTTDLYTKLAEKHQYLDYTSLHPEYTKKSLVYSQTLRLRRICSFQTGFIKYKSEMKS